MERTTGRGPWSLLFYVVFSATTTDPSVDLPTTEEFGLGFFIGPRTYNRQKEKSRSVKGNRDKLPQGGARISVWPCGPTARLKHVTELIIFSSLLEALAPFQLSSHPKTENGFTPQSTCLQQKSLRFVSVLLRTRIVERTVHIQLGRTGDLLILLPCWLKIYEQTGEKPIVVVSRDFADVLRGTSYIEPDIINGHWYANLSQAIKMAKIKYGKFVVTQCNGLGHQSHFKGNTFGEMMWDAAGFPGMYGQFPMVFDRRNKEREQNLLDKYTNKKPLILFNLTGVSSPLPAMSEIHNRLRRYQGKFNLLHIGSIRSAAIYDLLALYDIAAGLISIDTATLHLAAASKVPLLAYCRGGGASAIPKPGSMLVYYNEAHRKLDAIDEFVQSLEPLCCKSLT